MARSSGFSSRLRAIPLWIPGFLLVLGMTLVAWSYLRNHETEVAQERFRQEATEHFDRIQRSLKLAQNNLNAVGAYFDAAPVIDRHGFKRLTKPLLMQDRAIRALEWVPKVPADQRSQLVSQARKDGFPGFDFTERGPRGHMIPAAPRSMYFPVYFLEPYAGNEAALGFDLASNTARRQALNRAADTGKITASGRIRLVQESTRNDFGILIFRPVYTTDSTEHSLTTLHGFVLGVFSINHIVQDALGSAQDRVVLVDDDAPRDEGQLYPATESATNASGGGPLPPFIRKVSMAGRTWTVTITPRKFALTRGESDAVLILGLLISLLWAAYLRQKSQQHSAVERMVTERTHELSQERQFSHAVFNTIGNIVVVFDRSGAVVRLNHAGEVFTGVCLEELEQKPFAWEQFLPPEQRQPIRQVFERFYQGEVPKRYETNWLDKDGQSHLFDWTNTIIRDSAENPEYLICVGVDITERKKAENVLRSSERRFRHLFERNNEPMMLIDPEDGQIINVNKAAVAFYGWSESRMRSMKIDEINTLSPEEVAAEMAKADAEQRNYFVFIHRRANGQPRTVEVHTTPIEVSGRNLLVSIVHDISKRIRAERHVQQLLHEQSVMLDNGIVGIVRARNRNMIWANRALEQMLGYEPGELNGKPARSLYQSIEDYENFGRQAYTALDAGKNFHDQLQLKRKDGTAIWVDISGSLLDREHHETLWVFIDITDRKDAEEEIRQLAYFDPLTHLPNRRLLMDRLSRALSASNRRQEYGALMLLDMDHFKNLNDTQGHDAGDQMLVDVAQRLTSCIRQEDTVARLGGDEFVVLLELLGADADKAAERARTVAEKIRVVLKLPYEVGSDNASFHTTASIGVTLFRGQDESGKTLLKNADVALYQAKGAGRDLVHFFEPPTPTDT